MSDKIKVLDMKGSESGEITLSDKLVEREKGEQAIHESVVAYLASLRAGTASTKTRSEVRGGGKKPYRQKGTGRARAGSSRSPIWRGGGIIFGPKPRSYDKKVNKKVQSLALKRAFTERFDAGDLIVVDDINLAASKTKEMVSFLSAVEAGTRTVVIVNSKLSDKDYLALELAARNLPDVTLVDADSVNAYVMLSQKKVVITKDAIDVLTNRVNRGVCEDA